MDKKKLVIIIILFIMTAIFFEIVFLYDPDPASNIMDHETNRQNLWVIFTVITLSFIPCYMMGYGRFNPLLGFIPPFILNSLFWFLWVMKFNRSRIDLLSMEKNFLAVAISLTLLSSLFGVLIVWLVTKIRNQMTDETEKEQPEETVEQNIQKEDNKTGNGENDTAEKVSDENERAEDNEQTEGEKEENRENTP